MHRSRLVMRGADTRAGGMSITSGSSGASGMGASSSPSEGSAMAQSTRSSGAGSGAICLAKSSPSAWSGAASSTASLKWVSPRARRRRQPIAHTWLASHRSLTARAAHSADDWRRHGLFTTNSWEVSSMTERARRRVSCRRVRSAPACPEGHGPC